MKKLPVGLQNFQEIISSNFLYVDKTKQLYDVINEGKLYFLARPRRFGKSLLISTFQHLFTGKKDLFKDLYIGKETTYDWQVYPVLQFSFASMGHQVTNLVERLSRELQRIADDFQVEIGTYSVTEQFRNLIERIAQRGEPVVILIDEYDKPIVDFLTQVTQARINQKILKDFFSPLKELELKGYIRFLFITGVSKFSKVSLFSDLNNLTDLSNLSIAHDLTGITQQELLQYFPDYIRKAKLAFEMSEEELLSGVQLWYDGYSFEGNTRLYNPFSLLNFFRSLTFNNFWFATGTPTFLVESIRDNKIRPAELEQVEVAATFFDKFSLKDLDIIGLLFQTGYLTIKKVTRKRYKQTYFLGYPNIEVRQSFIHNLLEAFSYQPTSIVGNALLKIEQGLTNGNIELFIEQLKILLSDLSYFHTPRKKKSPTRKDEDKAFAMWEGYFHTIIYLITAFIGLEVHSEITKHKGRLDLLAETDDFLYLMEFKLEKPAKDAIAQIKNRDYISTYRNTHKKLILVGIGFSASERNVQSWEWEIWK